VPAEHALPHVLAVAFPARCERARDIREGAVGRYGLCVP
jgi:hypothetical protein